MSIQAVIFDMDGVLIDATEWHYHALNRALGAFGMEIERDQHLVKFNGLPTRTKLEILSAERGLPATLHPFINELKQIYTIEMIHTECRPTFIHQNALRMLKSDGYLIGVASNSIRPTVDLMMEKARLVDYLDEVVAASEVIRGKPDPMIYELAAAKLGVQPSNCLVVEDNAHGVAAAKAAGCHVLRVRAPQDTTIEHIRSAARLCGDTEPQIIDVMEVAGG